MYIKGKIIFISILVATILIGCNVKNNQNDENFELKDEITNVTEGHHIEDFDDVIVNEMIKQDNNNSINSNTESDENKNSNDVIEDTEMKTDDIIEKEEDINDSTSSTEMDSNIDNENLDNSIVLPDDEWN